MAPRESSKPSALSEEYVMDSSDDQDALHPAQAKNASTQGAPETPLKQRLTAKSKEHQKRKTTSPSRESSSKSQSQEEDGQIDGEDEDEDEPEVADFLDHSAKQAASKPLSRKEHPRKKSKTTPATDRSIPPKQYNPPPSFVQRSAIASDSGSHPTNFLSNNLTGKEVWHISAPANVPIESIRPFAIQAAMRGEPILKSEGKSYCLKDGPSTNKCTLTPNDTEDTYVPGKATISRTFHLRQITNPPAKNKESEVHKSTKMYFEFQPHDEMPVRPKRKQPEGLRMRYKPLGNTNASPEDSDAERSEIYIPDQIPTPPADDHHERRKKKSHQTPGSQGADADSDAMEMHPPRTPSGTQVLSPQSNKPFKNTPLKQVVREEGSAGQEKTKKKSKKNKDRGAAST